MVPNKWITFVAYDAVYSTCIKFLLCNIYCCPPIVCATYTLLSVAVNFLMYLTSHTSLEAYKEIFGLSESYLGNLYLSLMPESTSPPGLEWDTLRRWNKYGRTTRHVPACYPFKRETCKLTSYRWKITVSP